MTGLMEGYLPAIPMPVHAVFVARRYRTPGHRQSHCTGLLLSTRLSTRDDEVGF